MHPYLQCWASFGQHQRSRAIAGAVTWSWQIIDFWLSVPYQKFQTINVTNGYKKGKLLCLCVNPGPMASQNFWSEELMVHKDCSSGDRNGTCKDAQQLFRLVNFVCCYWAINPAKRQLRQRQTNKPKPDDQRRKKENWQTMTVKEKAFACKMSEDREHCALSRINYISIQYH